jgi:flagellar motor switch protein FliN/FliY
MPEPFPANTSAEQIEKIRRDDHPPGTEVAESGPEPIDPQTVSLDICLGTTTMTAGEAELFCMDHRVVMDQQAGDPVDLFLDGTFLARGILVILQGRFGVRITSLHDPATSPG